MKLTMIVAAVSISGCLHYPVPSPYDNEPLPPAVEKPDVDKFPQEGDSVSVRNSVTGVHFTPACCDVTGREEDVVLLGPPCNSVLVLHGVHRVTSCLTGRQEVL
jgi:hypothetical protein